MKVRAPRYACTRCGKKRAATEMIYSRWTHHRYCANLAECARRALRSAAVSTSTPPASPAEADGIQRRGTNSGRNTQGRGGRKSSSTSAPTPTTKG